MPNKIYADELTQGKPVKPIAQILLYSPEEWEEFIEEWLDIKKTEYVETERFGGAGDKGRDVVAYINKTKPNYQWDCYQCKHYNKAISPTNVYVEFGKIIYYTFLEDYPVPNKYYFVAPKGTGASLTDLLNNPEKLKQALKDNWNQYCKTNITTVEEVELVDDFLTYYDEFDFSIFDKIQPKAIIEEIQQKDNAKYLKRFSGLLPHREEIEKPPSDIQEYEIIYTKQLIGAYNTDKAENDFKSTDDISSVTPYKQHFDRARESFHTAEQLRNFSRDSLGEKAFNDLQKEIYDGIVDTVEDTEANRFKVVKQSESKATSLAIESNPLKNRCEVIDKKGICHQLVNDKKLKWVEDE